MTTLHNHKNTLVTYIGQLIARLDDASSFDHRLAVLLIFAIGIALRVYAWYMGEGYLYYAINDEILAYRYALGFLAGEPHTYYLAQPAFAAGQAPGPLWTLFWVMLLKLGHDSVHYALCWMALFNSIAVYLFYRLARHFVTPSLALFAMIYFALSPWTIYYSVGMWNPLPLVVIGSILFLSLWNVLTQDDSLQIFWVCLFSAIVPQFHMIGIFYLPIILFLLIINPHSINKKWLALGISAGIAIYIPYLIGEWQHDFANTRNMLTGTADHSYGVVKIFTAPLTMLTSIPAGWAGREFSDTIEYANTWFGSIYLLLLFCLLSLAYGIAAYFEFLKSAFYLFKRYWRKPAVALSQQPKIVFLASLIILPLILFVFTRHSYATRYTILIFPLLFLLPVIFYSTISKPAVKNAFIATTIIILLFNIYLTMSYFYYQGIIIHQDSKFAPSFKRMEKIAEELYAKIGNGKQIIITLSESIQSLPEGERKIAVALSEYFMIRNKYRNDQPPNFIEIKMDLKVNAPKTRVQGMLLQANGMTFSVENEK